MAHADKGSTQAVVMDVDECEAATAVMRARGMNVLTNQIIYKGGDGREKIMEIRCAVNVSEAGHVDGRRGRDAANCTAGRQIHYQKQYKKALETNSRLRHKWALKKVKAIGEGDTSARAELIASLGRKEALEMCEKHGVSMDDDGLGADTAARGGAGW